MQILIKLIKSFALILSYLPFKRPFKLLIRIANYIIIFIFFILSIVYYMDTHNLIRRDNAVNEVLNSNNNTETLKNETIKTNNGDHQKKDTRRSVLKQVLQKPNK